MNVRLHMPEMLTSGCHGQIRKGLEAAVSMRIAGEEAVHLARMYLGMGKYGVPMNPVAWDGYAHEREQVMAKLNIPGELLHGNCGNLALGNWLIPSNKNIVDIKLQRRLLIFKFI